MRISSLSVKNFKAIKIFQIDELNDLVLIVGANGVGKSTIYDAIRFIYSCYAKDLQNWFNEFQMNSMNEGINLDEIFRDNSRPSEIEITISLSDQERHFLFENSKKIILDYLQRENNISSRSQFDLTNTALFEPLSESEASKLIEWQQIIKELLKEVNLKGKVTIENNELDILDNLVLNIIFSETGYNELGILDFNGPNRVFARERLNSFNVNLSAYESSYKNSALYNYQNKYNNIKNELASNYIKALIAKQTGGNINKYEELDNSIKELFRRFFPGKEYIGASLEENGNLKFKIKLGDNSSHDINELSSGEKELVFGYLRMRNNSFGNSVILIDEPELHLNPKLAKELPLFYNDFLGKNLKNQIWLITHSDAILNESVKHNDFSIFHIHESNNDIENQAIKINLDESLEHALFELIGGLTTSYNPNNRLVLCEGENSEFDKNLISSLFPDFVKSVTLISLGGKSKVKSFHKTLNELKSNKVISKKIYSITDKDATLEDNNDIINHYNWPVYHIENFLLEEKYILIVLKETKIDVNSSEQEIYQKLRDIAKSKIEELVKIKLQEFVNNIIISSISISTLGSSTFLSSDLHDSIGQNIKRLDRISKTDLTKIKIQKKEKEYRKIFTEALNDNTWKSVFIGRNILREFCSLYCRGISYEVLISLIITKMSFYGFKPPNMEIIINRILDD